MNRKIIKETTLLLLLLSLLATSCYKDKGNYTYTNPNAVKLQDTLAGKPLVFTKAKDTIHFHPQVSQTLTSGDGNLVYEWKIYNGIDIVTSRVLATTKNLDMPVDSAFLTGQSYNVTYKVTDKNSGESSFLFYIMKIGDRFSEGWMLLEDTPQGTDFDMILPGGEIVHNVYQLLNGRTLTDKPVSMSVSLSPVSDNLSPTARKMYLLMKNSGMEMDYVNMSKRFDYGALFYTAPPVTQPTWMDWSAAGGTTTGITINQGKMSVNITGGFPGTKKWGPQLLGPENDLNYDLAPFVANSPVSTGLFYTAVVFDKTKQRFLALQNAGTSLDTFPAEASTIFNLNHPAMDLVYMDMSPAGQVNAFMRDAAGKIQFCRFKLTYTAAAQAITLMTSTLSSPDVENMTTAVSSWITDHIYYAVANSIYRYEPASGATVLQYEFPAGEKVVLLKSPIPTADAPQIDAITWNGSESKLYVFYITPTGSIPNYSTVYGGFGKVVDADYKFR